MARWIRVSSNRWPSQELSQPLGYFHFRTILDLIPRGAVNPTLRIDLPLFALACIIPGEPARLRWRASDLEVAYCFGLASFRRFTSCVFWYKMTSFVSRFKDCSYGILEIGHTDGLLQSQSW